MAVEAVRDGGFILRRGTGREDAELAVDLHRVGVDHHAAVLEGELHREPRLAARGRSGNQDGVGSGHGTSLTPHWTAPLPVRQRGPRRARDKRGLTRYDFPESQKTGGTPCRIRQISSARGADSAGLVQHRRRPAVAAAAAAPSRHRPADRPGRPFGDLPDGADRAGSVDRTRDRDPGAGPRDLQAVAAGAALPGAAAREGARYPGADFLQVRGREPAGQPQAQHGGAAGLLQQGGRDHEALDRDRRRAVGLLARLRRPALRHRGQGLHGQGLLQPEALSPGADGDLWRDLHREPEHRDQFRPRHPRAGPEFARQPRHRDLRGGRGGGHQSRHQLFARQRAQPRADPPVGDRHRGDRADGDGRLLAGRGDRLRRRRLELRRHRLPVHRQAAPRREIRARHRRGAGGLPVADAGRVRLRLRRHRAPDAAGQDAHAGLDLHPAGLPRRRACAITAWRRW